MITIIVLLILAGITLSFVLGENGIINRSKQGGEEYTKASLKEELQLKITDIEMEKLAKGEQLTRDNLQELSSIGAIVFDTGIPTLGEYKDYDFEINENYEVIIGSKLDGVRPTGNAEVVTTGVVANGGKVEIKVTSNITTGQITSIEPTNGAILKEDVSITEKRFEVTKNGTYYFKLTADNGRKNVVRVVVNTILEKPQISIKDVLEDEFTIVIESDYAPGAILEYQYYVDNIMEYSGTTEKSYTIMGLDEDCSYNQIFVKAICADGSTILTSESMSAKTLSVPVEIAWTNTTLANQTIDGKEASYQNPKIPVGFSAIQTDTAKWNITSGKDSDWNKGLVIKDLSNGNEFVWVPVDGNNLVFSIRYRDWDSRITYTEYTSGMNDKSNVSVNQGFWVARYETSKRRRTGEPLSKEGKIPWIQENWDQAKQLAESMYSNSYMQTGLVTLAQRDTMLKWIEDAGYSINGSSDWGNYTDLTLNLRPGRFSKISENSGNTWISSNTKPIRDYLLKTGASQTTRTNNIYDLAGNLAEWAPAKYQTTSTNWHYIIRGGSYLFRHDQYPATIDGGASLNGKYATGFRVVLYLK